MPVSRLVRRPAEAAWRTMTSRRCDDPGRGHRSDRPAVKSCPSRRAVAGAGLPRPRGRSADPHRSRCRPRPRSACRISARRSRLSPCLLMQSSSLSPEVHAPTGPRVNVRRRHQRHSSSRAAHGRMTTSGDALIALRLHLWAADTQAQLVARFSGHLPSAPPILTPTSASARGIS